MECKFIEIRDSATTIPAIAFRLVGETPKQSLMLAAAGYGNAQATQRSFLFLMKIDGAELRDDPFEWTSGSRTMKLAHMILHGPYFTHGIDELKKERLKGLSFDEIPDGGLIDIEYVLGLRDTPKLTEYGA